MKKAARSNLIFGKQLRQARTAAHLSQEKLAFKVGLDRTYISLLERGCKSPTLNTFFRLCEALHLDPQEIIAQVHTELINTPKLEEE